MLESTTESVTPIIVDLKRKEQIRVLHVDDESSLLRVARQCLEVEGYIQVDTASSVEEAHRKMKKRFYDAIISDYVMPDKDGLEFLKELRDNGSDIPFIIFTGKGREEVAIKALNLGADHYVSKTGYPETVYGELVHNINQAVARNRAERMVKESEEKFRKIFESAGDAIIYLDKKGRILGVNKKAEEIFGGSKEELVGKNFRKIGAVQAKDVPKVFSAFVKGVAGKPATLNIHIKNKKGKKILLESSASILKIDGEIITMVIARDITERRQAKEALKKSEEKYKELLAETPIGICNLDLKGQITYANKAFERITGYPNDEILGKSVYNLARRALLSEEQLKQVANQIKARLTGKRKSQPTTLQLRRKDGSLRWVEGESKLIKRFGMPTGLQAIIRDITERKQMEEKLTESEKRFRSIVENSHGGIGIVDDDFKIRYVNDQVTEILGYSKEEMIGQDFRKLLHGDTKSPIRDRYPRRQNGELLPAQYEFDVIRKNGEKRTVEMNVALIRKDQGRVQTVVEVLDVTQFKSAFKALQENEENFRNLAEKSPNMIFINKNGKIAYVNDQCTAVMGYTKKEFYSSDFDFLTLIAAESREVVTKAFNKHRYGEEVAPYEYALTTKEGKRIEAIITTKLIRYNGERAILGIVTDITERKTFEKALQESEERFRSIVENSHDGIGILGDDFKIEYINDQVTDLLGYSRDELVGQDFRKLLPVSSKSLVQNRYLQRQKGKNVPSTYEFEIVHKNGEKMRVEVKASTIYNSQGRVQTIAQITDVTKRKKAEKVLIENIEKFERLFIGNPEATVHVDSNFQILNVNPLFTQLFGYSLGEIKGKRIDDMIVPEDKVEEAKMLDKKAENGYIYYDTIRRKKDGTLIPVSLSAAPLIIEGKLAGYIGVYKDTSQLRSTEMRLKQTLEKLHVVGDLARHDVRNKLAVITGNIYLTKKQTTNRQILEHLEEIESSVQQAQGIFDFARDYESLGVEKMAPTDVGKAFDSAVSIFSNMNNVKIANDCNGLVVLADSLLRQLFYNLIDNSLKHGAKVNQIRAYYEETSHHRRLIYEDDGVGIPESKKERIFEEGYGSDTGYGLYLIRKICGVYGWSIRETGKHQKGAQFTITIPKLRK